MPVAGRRIIPLKTQSTKPAMTFPASIPAKFRRLAVLAAILCSGCAGIQTKTPEGKPVLMGEDDFAKYFEQVFRHHNAVVNESLFAAPTLVRDGGDPLADAEMRMNHACQPLNEAASAAAVGQYPDFWTKLKLVEAVPECEMATRNVEKLLSTP